MRASSGRSEADRFDAAPALRTLAEEKMGRPAEPIALQHLTGKFDQDPLALIEVQELGRTVWIGTVEWHAPPVGLKLEVERQKFSKD